MTLLLRLKTRVHQTFRAGGRAWKRELCDQKQTRILHLKHQGDVKEFERGWLGRSRGVKAVCPSVEKAAWQGAEERPLRVSAGFIRTL